MVDGVGVPARRARERPAMTGLLLLLALAQPVAAPPGLLFGFAKRAITPDLERGPVYPRTTGHHSPRRATTGSTRVARRAGRPLATSATRARNTGTPA